MRRMGRTLERFWLRAALIGLGALFLLWTPLLNRYPFIYSDSGAYIYSGALMYVPPDRSIGYGIFLARINLLASLWAVVVLQALLLGGLMFRAAELVLASVPARARSWLAFGIIVVTALTTTVSTFVGFISPDIFTSCLFLSGLVFVLTPHRDERIVAAALIALALWVHNSHLILGAAMLLLLALAGSLVWRKRIIFRRIVMLSIVVVGAFVAMAATNFYLRAGFTISRGGTTILLNRFVAAGVLAETLATYCGEQQWVLCDYQAQLRQPHDQPDWYLWGNDSPIKLVGWDKNEPEQRALLGHAFQCCAARILVTSAAEAWKQFWLSTTGDQITFLGNEWNAVTALARFYPNEVAAFQSSAPQRQTRPKLSLLPFPEAPTQFTFLVLCVGLTALAARRKESTLALTMGALLLFLALNAALVGALNGASGRYQARIVWLVPYWTYVAAATFLYPVVARILARSHSSGNWK